MSKPSALLVKICQDGPDLQQFLGGTSPALGSLGCGGAAGSVTAKPRTRQYRSRGAAEQGCPPPHPRAEQDTPPWAQSVSCLLLPGQRCKICVHPCSHRLACLQCRAGDQGLGTGTCPGLTAWGRAGHVLKAALVTRMLLCKLGAPCAAPWGRGSSEPPEMGILKHHKNASPSAERKHIRVGMRWNWMAE